MHMRAMPRAKKSQQKISIFNKTTGLCPSRSYYSIYGGETESKTNWVQVQYVQYYCIACLHWLPAVRLWDDMHGANDHSPLQSLTFRSYRKVWRGLPSKCPRMIPATGGNAGFFSLIFVPWCSMNFTLPIFSTTTKIILDTISPSTELRVGFF